MRRAMIIASLALGLALSACTAPVSTTTTTVPTMPVVVATSQQGIPTTQATTQGTGMGQGNQGTGMGQGNQGTGMGQGNQGTGMGQGNQGTGMGQGNQGTGMGQGNQGQPTTSTTVLPSNLPETPCPMCNPDLSQYRGSLSATEINGLLLALNDEYHAWAVYQQVSADFGEVRPFANIIASEATHITRLETLFTTYGVPLPATNPWVGQAPRFASVSAACTGGVDAEIVNVNLYTRLMDSTTRADILLVYQQLQAASRDSHLPAFQRCA